MFRLIPSSDWQLGARYAQFGTKASHLREARMGTLKRTLELAAKHEADAFLIAGRYLLGVECDGATYHRAATARDRDKLRQMILEGLGWKLHRVWSTDWWHDSNKEMDKLIEALATLHPDPVAPKC